MKKTFNQKGFTLVELLVSVTIMLIAVALSADIIISIFKGYNKAQSFNDLEQSSTFLTIKLENDIRTANNAIITTSTSSDGATLLDLQKSSDNSHICYQIKPTDNIYYKTSADLCDFSIDSNGALLPINLGKKIDSTSTFSVLTNSATNTKIAVTYKFVFVGKGTTTSETTISNTIVMRGAY